MIVRTWKGAVRTEDTDAYVEYLQATGIADYATTPGNLGVCTLRRARPDGCTEVMVLTLWTSLDAVRAFAGPELEEAVFYPQDDRFLVERDLTATHWELESLRARR